jgi:hypothetical protein
MYFPLSFYFKKYNFDYVFIYKLLSLSSFFLSIVLVVNFFILKLLFSSDIFAYSRIIENIFGSNVLWFRQGGFVFYPGLLFVLFSNVIICQKVFTSKEIKLFDIVTIVLGCLAILLSMTKGLIIINALAFCAVFFFSKTGIVKKIAILFISLILIWGVVQDLDLSRFSNISKDSGMVIRMKTFDESLYVANNSILFGNGFGTELDSKKHHQENSYLDILVEQGLIGLTLYILLLGNCLLYVKTHFPLVVSISALSLTSITNPYINNPLGISMYIIVLILLKQKRKCNE